MASWNRKDPRVAGIVFLVAACVSCQDDDWPRHDVRPCQDWRHDVRRQLPGNELQELEERIDLDSASKDEADEAYREMTDDPNGLDGRVSFGNDCGGD